MIKIQNTIYFLLLIFSTFNTWADTHYSLSNMRPIYQAVRSERVRHNFANVDNLNAIQIDEEKFEEELRSDLMTAPAELYNRPGRQEGLRANQIEHEQRVTRLHMSDIEEDIRKICSMYQTQGLARQAISDLAAGRNCASGIFTPALLFSWISQVGGTVALPEIRELGTKLDQFYDVNDLTKPPTSESVNYSTSDWMTHAYRGCMGLGSATEANRCIAAASTLISVASRAIPTVAGDVAARIPVLNMVTGCWKSMNEGSADATGTFVPHEYNAWDVIIPVFGIINRGLDLQNSVITAARRKIQEKTERLLRYYDHAPLNSIIHDVCPRPE